MFNLPDDNQEYSASWSHVLDANLLGGKYGMRTNEPSYEHYMQQYRYDVNNSSRPECQWNGPVWPFQTTQVLLGISNVLDHYENKGDLSISQFNRLLSQYVDLHYGPTGKPNLEEDYNPDKGGTIVGLDRSPHYFHSGFIDIVLGGLVGIRPRSDDKLEINPLVDQSSGPSWFRAEEIPYHGSNIAVQYDRDGSHYGKKGLIIERDGQQIASSDTLQRIIVDYPAKALLSIDRPSAISVQLQESSSYPRGSVSSNTGDNAKIHDAIDGRIWFTSELANGWESDTNSNQWYAIELGNNDGSAASNRTISRAEIAWFADENEFSAPVSYTIETSTSNQGPWTAIPNVQQDTPLANGITHARWTSFDAGLITYEVDTHLNASVLQRNLRTGIAGAEIALDYKFNFKSGDQKSADELHERCAKRLLRVCEQNGGLYIKLGQAIGVQAAVLPKPYHALAKMFDDAEHMPTNVVRAVVEKELGRPIDEVYSSFDDQPIAAASVAQVHKATLKSTGETVAVKVQRPSIRSQAYWDLLSFRILLHFYSHVFDLPLAYFGGYISEQIERETDFLAELENGKKARNNIANDPQKVIRDTCYVPWCVDEFSTSRILTMEFIQGATRMTDEKGIRNMGLNVKEVARSVCEVFASQIFQHGFVQCDGHAGNVLVRKHPNGKKGQHQVVLIDHGLYVSISETFRRQYAELWKAIFEVDISTLERITTAWGMGKQSAELFASATLMRPWRKPKTDEEREKEEEERKKNNGQPNYNKQKEMIKNFLVSVELVPKELIFVGRSMRIVQANNQVLHSPVNRINILARHAASALLTNDSPTFLSIFRPHGKQQQQSTIMERFRIWDQQEFHF
ncbi:hypothetical protein L7F22_044076 [Adiantum nelumboides]|nr:hypothetical protein [Adiantum nelumboides]